MPANQVAGVIVEPVIGEGGIIIPPDDFLPGLRALCDKLRRYLCIDEVLGLRPLREDVGHENWGVEPDLIVVGKGISAARCRSPPSSRAADITEKADAYVASTYSGHPAACAAAIKTIEILYRDRLFDHANELGALRLRRLQALKDECAALGDVRGIGLWVAAEFVKDDKTRKKNIAFASRVNRRVPEERPLPDPGCPTSYIRIQPPLNIERPLFEQGLDIPRTRSAPPLEPEPCVRTSTDPPLSIAPALEKRPPSARPRPPAAAGGLHLAGSPGVGEAPLLRGLLGLRRDRR